MLNLQCMLWRHQILFWSPHSHIPSRIGIRDLPRSAALLKWKMVGEVLVPGVLNVGDIEKTDGCGQAEAFADNF